MNARLGFSIAAHLDPDVLLIDEVLSVGDAGVPGAVRRAHARADQAQGMPLVFVSHNLPAVLELCTRAIVIDHGTSSSTATRPPRSSEYRRAPTQQARSQRVCRQPDSPWRGAAD